VYEQVVGLNEYNLPEHFDPSDTIVDLGAHFGSFMHACLIRGAGTIHCVEPHASNFALLECNVKGWTFDTERTVHCYNRAVWGKSCKLGISGEFVNWTARMHVNEEHAQVDSITLDELLATVGGPVRLLKMDIEGAEVPALECVSDLSQVREIVGEIHYGLHFAGWPKPTNGWLMGRLNALGFREVTIEPNRIADQHGAKGSLGSFRATR
jgi:FkbM family methyltransferase